MIPPARYRQLRTVGQVALGVALFGAFALGFRMLGTPDLVALALPQLYILQSVTYAIIVIFSVYLAIWEAVLRPLQRQARQRLGDTEAVLPLPAQGPPGDLSVPIEGAPPHSRILYWSNAEEGATWEQALASFSRNARMCTADAKGHAVLQPITPQPYTDELGLPQPARTHYRFEIGPGGWSAIRRA